jgi:hypothetical protein
MDIIDTDTGEIIDNKFAKLFFSDIEKLFGLNRTELNVFLLMAKMSKIGGSNSINLTPEKKKIIFSKLGLKSHIQVTNAIRSLIIADIVKKVNPRDRFDFLYQINPHILFKGNDYQRAKIIIEYSSGKRKVEVVEIGSDEDKK